MKNYAITIEHQGAVVISAKSKKEAIIKFNEKGYNVKNNKVYIY